ncbi:MAG: methionine--tRNA ligase [Halanaerobiaceae bacterium]
MSIYIGGAWPYANGSLHLGHLASLLPGDIIARYYRLKGEEVLYVSGSDCHGTPIALKADKENIAPQQIAEKHHQEFKNCFEKLGFSYDNYSRTDKKYHHNKVQEMFLKLYKNKYIYNKSTRQLYCNNCDQFLPDRYVEGICPDCGNIARGDQCDYCSSLIDPLQLKDRKCKICGKKPKIKKSEQFYLALSKFQKQLQKYVTNTGGWRENSYKLTERYLSEGLQDRAITRDLSWGIDVPLPGYENKKIYVWMEAVLGYLTASQEWAEKNNREWRYFWNDNTTSYYIHGKDNIPFHSLILPALLSGLEDDLTLPDKIISSEYLTIEGKKLSTSNNWAIWVPYVLKNYNPDSIRYFLTINGPEKRDSDFSWGAYIHSHNGELLGAFGNFVNRTLTFVKKYFDSRIPKGKVNSQIRENINLLYKNAGKNIEKGKLKEALKEIFDFIRDANKYFDQKKPWETIKTNHKKCRDTIYTCIQIIVNLTNLLSPFIPFSTEKIKSFFNTFQFFWNYTEIFSGNKIYNIEKLYKRIDKKQIDKERRRLKSQKQPTNIV